MARRRLGAGGTVVAVLCIAGVAMWWSVGARVPRVLPVASVQGVQADRNAVVDPALTEVVRSSVMLIESSGCGERRQGTTTMVDGPDGPVGMTNQHVVRGSDMVESSGADGATVKAAVRARVQGRDAVRLDARALLDAGLRPLPVGPRPIVGSTVMVAGFPSGGFDARAGHIERVDRRQGYGGTVDMLIIDVAAIPGISGGVVVDGEGRAVGLVAARDPQTGDTVAYPLDTLTGPGADPVSTC